ncbi:MAG: hypothetical protein VB997_08350, partial [Opitutales bacterium]
ELQSARKKLSPEDKARENSIKNLTKLTEKEREAATKAQNELILFDAHRVALAEEHDRRKAELSATEKRKPNRIDPVRVIETFVAGIVKLPMKVELAESCKPNASITVCGHHAFWGRSGNIVKDVSLDLKKKNEGSVELDLSKVKLSEGTYPLFFSTNITGKHEVYSEEDAKEAEVAAEKFKARVKSAQEAVMESKNILVEVKAKLAEAKKAKDAKLMERTKKTLLARNDELKILETKAKRMDAKGKKAAARAKEVLDGSKKPRDYSANLYVTPFLLKVREAPIEIKPLQKRTLKVGEKLDLPVVIRRYGDFADPVSLKVVLPSEAKGFSINSTNVEKGMYAAIIEIVASAEASPANSLECMLEATFKFNNRPIKVSEPFILKVDPLLGS